MRGFISYNKKYFIDNHIINKNFTIDDIPNVVNFIISNRFMFNAEQINLLYKMTNTDEILKLCRTMLFDT